MKYQGVINRYRNFMPLDKKAMPVTLFEGNTPLIRLTNLESHLKTSCEIYAKFEGMNPTGSFKDRGMTVAISHAKSEGAKAVICASTGNTSAAAAAYAARANMKCVVLIPEGKIAMGKLAQAVVHNAQVIQIEGNFDQGMDIVKTLSKRFPLALVNSVNPYRLHGQKTAAFEIIDELNRVPDYHVLPVGNAGNISAYYMGYSEYFQQGITASMPRMVGFQAEGAAPFIKEEFVCNPETVATAIRIGAPQSWDLARNAVEKTNGWFGSVSDYEILAAQRLLASLDGIFCEPASAACVAGLIKGIKKNQFNSGVITCTLTGHGLKDPNVAIDQSSGKISSVPAELAAIESLINL